MRALVVTEHGPAIRDVPIPELGPAEVRVRVRACALNRIDLTMAQGHKHGGAGGVGNVLGVEWAGEIDEVGADVQGLTPGQAVMGSGAGAFAEYAVADWGRVLPLPTDSLALTQAATLPIALQTMHDALVTNGGLEAGDSVLIQGASSGVGLMGLQIARLLGASLVAGTSTNEVRRARLGEFGAELALDSSDPDWVAQIRQATDGKGVDLIIDQVSGPLINASMHAAAIRGRIVNVGRLGGNSADFNFDLHALKRLSYIGVTFRTRNRYEVREITRRMREDLWPALAAGELHLPVDREFPLQDAVAALDYMAENRHFGKIVLRTD